jgi:hypothetical protein
MLGPSARARRERTGFAMRRRRSSRRREPSGC